MSDTSDDVAFKAWQKGEAVQGHLRDVWRSGTGGGPPQRKPQKPPVATRCELRGVPPRACLTDWLELEDLLIDAVGLTDIFRRMLEKYPEEKRPMKPKLDALTVLKECRRAS